MLEIACPAQGGKAKITVEMSSKITATLLIRKHLGYILKAIKLNQL